jgi:hypothetical protein
MRRSRSRTSCGSAIRTEDIHQFTKAFLKDLTFFQTRKRRSLEPFRQPVRAAAAELFEELGEAGPLPMLDEQPLEDVAAWPMLRLQVAADKIDAVSVPARRNHLPCANECSSRRR